MMSALNDGEEERINKMLADGVITHVGDPPGSCSSLGATGSVGCCGGPVGPATVGANPKDLIGATKPPLSLVPPCFHVYVAMAMKNGAKKYGSYNWRAKKVQSMIYLDAAMRHIQSFIDGETNAKDSGQPHLAHAAACMAILLDAFLNDCVIDNRPTAGKTAELIEQLTENKKPLAPKLPTVDEGIPF